MSNINGLNTEIDQYGEINLHGFSVLNPNRTHDGKGFIQTEQTNDRVSPLISVITVVYNGGAKLRSTIESVAQQNRSDIEYIVVDGGSTDDTYDILRELDDQIDHWVSEPDHGIYNAMNKAVQLATEGAYILFIGAGDRILKLPDVDEISRAKDAGIRLLHGNVIIGKDLFLSSFNVKLRYRNTIHHQGMFLLKLSSNVPWFDERLKVFADWDLNLSLFQRHVPSWGLNYTVAYADPGGVSASLHLFEIVRMIHRRCGAIGAFAAAIYHGALYIFRQYASISRRSR